MKSKVVLMTKKKLVIYGIILLLVLVGIALLTKIEPAQIFAPKISTVTGKIELQAGEYIGNEVIESGNIQVAIQVKKGKIKEIKLNEFPQSEYDKDSELEKDMKNFIKAIVKSQNEDVKVDGTRANAYIFAKVYKAVNQAIQQATLSQVE